METNIKLLDKQLIDAKTNYSEEISNSICYIESRDYKISELNK